MFLSLKENKNRIIRGILFAILIIIVSLFQNTPGFFPSIFGVRAMLLIPLICGIAMFEGETAGALYGLFAGALWDIVVAKGQGYHSIYLMLFGFACGYLLRQILRNNLLSSLFLCGVGTLLHQCVYWFLFFVVTGVPNMGYALYRFYLPNVLYTLALMPITYFFIRSIIKWLPQGDIIVDDYKHVKFED